LTVAVGSRVEFCWWIADDRGAAMAAINDSIRAVFPYWYRDVVTEGASSGITLSAGDDEYALPAACDALMAVGVGADPITWIPAVRPDGRVNYSVEGQAGAFVVRFAKSYTRGGTVADEFTGKTLALHYATKEPVLVESDTTCQLPLEFFTDAASVFVRQSLNDASRLDLVVQNVNLPQIQQAAQAAVQKLGLVKPPPVLLGMQQAQAVEEEKEPKKEKK
jgi:hypothetical protein